MKISERTLRISASSLLALSFVGVAYLLSGPSFLTSRLANAGSTEELLKAYASKDTDGDSLPDWQEALYGTDPSKADTDGDGMSDGEAARQGKLTPNALASQLPQDEASVTLTDEDLPGIDPAAGSITEQFSKEFLQEFISASNGAPMDDEAKQALIQKLLTKFTAKASQLLNSSYTAVSLHTDTLVTAAQYAGSIETVLRAHDVPADANQPLPLMEALIQNNDETARPKLVRLADSYAAITMDLVAVRVPPQLATQHLKLIQGFDKLSKATTEVTIYEKDPLGTMGALSTYQPASNQIVEAFTSMAAILVSTGEPAPGTPGALIVSIARSTEKP